MNKFKSLISIFVFMSILLLLPTPVLADEEVDRELIMKSYQPTTYEEAWYIFEDAMMKLGGYWIDIMNLDAVCNATYTRCTVHEGSDSSGPEQIWDFIYDYDPEIKEAIDSIVNELPEGKAWYALTELDYMNYLIYGVKADVSMATYSSELKKYINYKNFFLDFRLGGWTPLFIEKGGVAAFIYGDTIYNILPETFHVYHDHLFYLEDDVTDERSAIENKLKAVFPGVEITVTDEEIITEDFVYNFFYNDYNPEWMEGYEDADDYATQMINNMSNEDDQLHYLTDYFNNNIYSVLIDEEGSDEAITEYFVAVKDSSKVTDSKLITSDLKTDVTISADYTIPLDTMIRVSKLTSGEEYEKILDVLKMTNIEAFDLNLFSKSVDDYITELEDGTFEVRIPISEKFRNKKLVVYYVDDDDKVTEYKVTIDGDFAVFHTNHFSTYTLGEEIENPATGDNLTMNIIIGAISLIGIVNSGLYLNKKRNN